MAAETRLINTRTDITTNGTLEIKISYEEPVAFILEFFNQNVDRVVSGVSFTGGDLGYNIEGSNDLFSIENTTGDLVVASDDPAKYSIDENGDLILTE